MGNIINTFLYAQVERSPAETMLHELLPCDGSELLAKKVSSEMYKCYLIGVPGDQQTERALVLEYLNSNLRQVLADAIVSGTVSVSGTVFISNI